MLNQLGEKSRRGQPRSGLLQRCCRADAIDITAYDSPGHFGPDQMPLRNRLLPK
jgi:hypothetical protein